MLSEEKAFCFVSSGSIQPWDKSSHGTGVAPWTPSLRLQSKLCIKCAYGCLGILHRSHAIGIHTLSEVGKTSSVSAVQWPRWIFFKAKIRLVETKDRIHLEFLDCRNWIFKRQYSLKSEILWFGGLQCCALRFCYILILPKSMIICM